MAMIHDNAATYINASRKAPTYAFLSQPPPQKKRPTMLLPALPTNVEPCLPRSATFAAKISAWAAHVQPGSPAPLTPSTPQRSPSVSSRRRPSLNLGHSVSGGISHNRVVSSPFVIMNTPTTASHKTFDFTAVGYNGFFVSMPPKTPETPSPLLREKAMKEQVLIENKIREKQRVKEESKERKDKVMKRIRSLTNLKPRSKSISKPAASNLVEPLSPPGLPTSPAYTTATAPAMSNKTKKAKKSTTKPSQKKKAAYGHLVRAPPTLHNELALMQFADGGKMDGHIRRVMVGPDGAVGDVHRDGKGGVWWDREEEMEYRGLLVESESNDGFESEEESKVATWVEFRRDSIPQTQGRSSEETLVAPQTEWAQKGKNIIFERRESASTLSSKDSDLDPVYLMQTDETPAYHDERVLDFDLRASSNATETLKANNKASRRNGMLLCLPARPFRAAKHLRKPEYMLDLQAFGVVPKSPRSPLSPSRFSNTFGLAAIPVAKPRGKARRRPAPLKISPAMMKLKRVIAVSSPTTAALPPLPPLPPIPTSTTVAPTTITDLRQQQLVIKEGKQAFALDSFQPEVSKFDDDSDCDDVMDRNEMKEYVRAGLQKRTPARPGLRGLFGTAIHNKLAF